MNHETVCPGRPVLDVTGTSALPAALGALIAALALPAWSSESTFVRGDSSGDAELSLDDALGTLGYFFLPDAPGLRCPDAADYDDDGMHSLSDVIGALNFMFVPGSIPPSPPFPGCGVDPTPEDPYGCEGPLLGCPPLDAAPRFEVLFAGADFLEDPGLFIVPNVVAAGEDFAEERFRMRPVTLAVPPQLTTGTVGIEASAEQVELYLPDGTVFALPASVSVDELPLDFLLNATDHGTASLVATASVTGQSAVVTVRAGSFPGLAGRGVPRYPFFEFVQTIHDFDILQAAIDPGRHRERSGLAYDIHVVEHRTPAEWAASNVLVDVTEFVEHATVSGTAIQGNTVILSFTGLDGGDLVGKGYDIVYDFGGDGTLDPGDLIDGFDDEAGFYVVKDLSVSGPYPVTTVLYTGGVFLAQRTVYPSDIASMGALPLVVISHGNGHSYLWYDYLQRHLASHGYIVMSHTNDTMPGVLTAATTTHENTEYFLGNLDVIEGGIFAGHVDSSRIVWIGHSRGGEGVVIAYDRIFSGAVTPKHFDLEDIVLVSSIAPSVFTGTSVANPHDVNYHLLAGASDGDVTGGADCDICQFLRIPQAGTGNVHVTYVQGASHNDFNCCGFNDGVGPARIGRPAAQIVAKSYYLALIELYVRANPATRDYFTRMYEKFHPSGIPLNVVVATQFKEALASGNEIIDDYQDKADDPNVSSSGAAVTFDVTNVSEERLDDGNSSFTWFDSDPTNGMTQAETSSDLEEGVMLEWSAGSATFYELAIPAALRDFSDNAFLAFRACQGTRHPETVALGGPLDFTVTLVDGTGTTSSINFDIHGHITAPYGRPGLGAGLGWANEFNSVRIRIADFENNYSGIQLGDIVAIRFEFGGPFGSRQGRIGLDDVMLTHDR